MTRIDEQLSQTYITNGCVLHDVVVTQRIKYNVLSTQDDVHGEFLSENRAPQTIRDGFRLFIGEKMDFVTLHPIKDGLVEEAIASAILSPSHINNFGNNANDIRLTSNDGFHYWYRVSARGHFISLFIGTRNTLTPVSTIRLNRHLKIIDRLM